MMVSIPLLFYLLFSFRILLVSRPGLALAPAPVPVLNHQADVVVGLVPQREPHGARHPAQRPLSLQQL